MHSENTEEAPALSGGERLQFVFEEIEWAEKYLAELKGSVSGLLAQIVAETPEAERQDMVDFLYWHVPLMGAEAIQNAFGLQHRPATIGRTCSRCGEEFRLLIKSRSHLQRESSRFSANHAICEPCRSARDAAHDERWHARHRRIAELKTMPYSQYLASPEWQARRQQHLKSAGYKCQLCNSGGVVLNVHHRTYERRGEEYFKDLIVLCRDCHAKFHNKLVEEPV